MSLGKRIKKARLAKGYTQRELAEKCQVLQKNLSIYENDQVVPLATTLKRIAEALDVTTDWLLGNSSVQLANPDFLKALNRIDKLAAKEKEALLLLLNTFLSAAGKGKGK